MRRRTLLRTIAIGGVTSTSVGIAAGTPDGRSGGVSAADLDAVHVVRDGDVVATLTDPSDRQIKWLFEATGDDEGLITPEECCLEECRSDCAYCDYPPGCTTNCCCSWYDDSC